MRAHHQVGVHARRRWRTARSAAGVAGIDLVRRNFNPTGPNQLWAADVTQFRTGEGWLYLAAVVDLWSRRVIGFKTELVRWDGPWHGLDDLELATLGYVDWFNHVRIYQDLGYRTPVEVEADYYDRSGTPDEHPLAGQPAMH
jgi:transposase InsO family protein